MALRELLIERRSALSERWLDAVLREYGEVTAARWGAERDRFANPIGHALADGLPELLDAVACGRQPGERALAALEGIVRIRSVQDLAPSRAAAFPLLLRRAVRDELGPELAAAHAAELTELDARLEQLVLVAFDTYVALREEMYRLRQEELRRSVASILRRWGGGGLPEEVSEDLVRLAPPPGPGERR
ncbi:MAG TPA: RsbRD N-terminal domain-containing protein [Anaeromyxobacter sp.]|nr:RsbRD N-terminal domain-containing protein [Anaeromyxobacter sp.]